MRIGAGLKQKHVDRYLQAIEPQLVPGERILSIHRVLNLRPGLSAIAVTDIRIAIVDNANRYYGHMAFYDVEQCFHDPAKNSLTVIETDRTGFVFKGIAGDESVGIVDIFLDAKDLPRNDPRFVALARRDQRTDLDLSGEPGAAPAVAAAAAPATPTAPEPVAAPEAEAAPRPAPPAEPDDFGFLDLDIPDAPVEMESPPVSAPPAVMTASVPAEQLTASEGSTAKSDDAVARLEKLVEMFEQGLLTAEEFAALKQRTLQG